MMLIRRVRVVEVRSSARLLVPIRAICHRDGRSFLQMYDEPNIPFACRTLTLPETEPALLV